MIYFVQLVSCLRDLHSQLATSSFNRNTFFICMKKADSLNWLFVLAMFSRMRYKSRAFHTQGRAQQRRSRKINNLPRIQTQPEQNALIINQVRVGAIRLIFCSAQSARGVKFAWDAAEFVCFSLIYLLAASGRTNLSIPSAVSCKVGECDARARSETYPRPLTLFGRLRQTKHFKVINNNGYWFDFLTLSANSAQNYYWSILWKINLAGKIHFLSWARAYLCNWYTI
jgi:hypothetical protein